MVPRCSVVGSKVKLGECRRRAKRPSRKEMRKRTKSDPKYSKVPPKTVMESRTELDQRGAVNGVSPMGLLPAQGGAYLQVGRRVE